MKKKILSILISVILTISCCAFSAYAADYDYETERKKLGMMVGTYENFEYEMGAGYPYIYFDSEAYNEIWGNAVSVYYNPNSTADDYHQAFTSVFDLIFNEQIINPEYAEQTYINALGEIYSEDWYTQEEWNEFQSKTAELGNALELCDETDEQSMHNMTDAFHDLLRAYNTMTNHDPVAGDVNGNKKVDIRDVTEIQRSLAEVATLNGAQKMRASVSNDRRCEEISIKDATLLQRYLAEFTDDPVEYSSYPIFVSESRTNALITEDYLTEHMFNFAICPRNDFICYDVTTGYYSVQMFVSQIRVDLSLLA